MRIIVCMKPQPGKIVTIVVSKRRDDYHACPEGETGLWDCGRTRTEAIGNLIQTHPERFGITLVDGGAHPAPPPYEIIPCPIHRDDGATDADRETAQS